MARLSPKQLGICSWSLGPKNPADLADKMQQVGVNKVQLALNPLRDNPKLWGNVKQVLADRDVQIVSGMFGCIGEDYSTLESIRRTGGIVPDKHWQGNLQIVKDAAQLCAGLGLTLVSTHAGFLPEDHADPDHAKLVDRIGQMATVVGDKGLTLLFETGQETADNLASFLDIMRRQRITNVGVNFDPANMILYGKGEPVTALKKLLPWVRQIHVKDAVATTTPGTWGAEAPVGEGDVDWRPFVQTLADGRFTGDLIIEREGGSQRIAEARSAADLITRLMGESR